MVRKLEIPPYVPLGAYAEEHDCDVVEFVHSLFRTTTMPEITYSNPDSDWITVRFRKERTFDGYKTIPTEEAMLQGSVGNFAINGSFSIDCESREAWARWCLEHCGHWAYGED